MNGPTWYTYPDGAKSSRRPKDGEKFDLVDGYGAVDSTWEWDDFLEQWFNISSGRPNKHNTATFATGQAAYHYYPGMTPSERENAEFERPPIHAEPKLDNPCKCGGWAVKATRHAHYCPLFHPNL